MDVERALIAKCIEGNVEKVVSRQIGPQHFEQDDNRAVFQTIVKHMVKYGAAPSRDAVLAQHPGYTIDIVTDTLDYYIDVFARRVQRREAKKASLDIITAIDQANDDTQLDIVFMEHTMRVAQAIPMASEGRLSEVQTRISLYNKMLREGRLPGITLGVPSLDAIVLGVQNHEMVVVGAASNVGKSTFLQHIALSAYLDGKKIVFITLEMTKEALLRRFDSMATNFRYQAMRSLDMNQEEIERWAQWAERTKNAANDIIVLDKIENCTVERVFAETLRYKPDAMFVDYFGIMTPSQSVGRDEKAHVGMAQMAKQLKKVPITTGIPLFTAAQMNREGFKSGGATGANVADTIEIFRSADIMIALERDEEENPNEMLAKLIKTRDSGKGQATLDWDMETMDFSERRGFGKGRPVVFSSNPVTDTPKTQAPSASLEVVSPAAPINPFMELSA